MGRASAERLLDRAYAALEEGRLDEARRGFAEAEKAGAHPADVLTGYGHLALEEGDADAAIAVADELLEEEDPGVDGLFLAAEVLLDADRLADARTAAARLAELVEDEPAVELPLAELLVDLGDLAGADARLRRLVAREPALADAWHLLSEVRAELGELGAAREARLRTLALDRAEPRPEPLVTEDEVESAAVEALGALPARVRELLVGVPIVLEDEPAEDFVAEGGDPRTLGLFDGVAHPEKSHLGGSPSAPDRIVLYLRCLERAFPEREALLEEIRVTVWHETAHYFGLDEDEVAALGLG